MVLEVRPAILHTKADAVQWLEAAAKRRGVWSAADPAEPLRLYVGDDDTDEDVFRLWPGVVGVRVGPGAPPHRGQLSPQRTGRSGPLAGGAGSPARHLIISVYRFDPLKGWSSLSGWIICSGDLLLSGSSA